MQFTIMLAITLALAIATSLILTKLLNPAIEITMRKIFNGEMHSMWIRYVKIAFMVVGISSGINLRSMEDFILRINKSLTIERIIAEGFNSIKDSAISIMLLMLLLFFIYLVVSYLNQLAPSSNSIDKKESLLSLENIDDIDNIDKDIQKNKTSSAISPANKNNSSSL